MTSPQSKEPCLYSWGSQYATDDFSDLWECKLEKHHAGVHKDGKEEFCSYCEGYGSDNGQPCPDCGKEQIR